MRVLVSSPGKRTMTREIFEHTAARKPVLNNAGAGAAGELVCKIGIGSGADPSDVEGLVRESARLRRTISEVSYFYSDATVLLRQYDRRCIAGCIASVLDRVYARQ
jgi:hypothetical protein